MVVCSYDRNERALHGFFFFYVQQKQENKESGLCSIGRDEKKGGNLHSWLCLYVWKEIECMVFFSFLLSSFSSDGYKAKGMVAFVFVLAEKQRSGFIVCVVCMHAWKEIECMTLIGEHNRMLRRVNMPWCIGSENEGNRRMEQGVMACKLTRKH